MNDKKDPKEGKKKSFEVLILAGSSLKLSKKAKFSEATAQQLARTGPNGFHGT